MEYNRKKMGAKASTRRCTDSINSRALSFSLFSGADLVPPFFFFSETGFFESPADLEQHQYMLLPDETVCCGDQLWIRSVNLECGKSS
jgi:hypothetical protein